MAGQNQTMHEAEAYLRNTENPTSLYVMIDGKWKTQARLTLAAKTVLTPENYFNLTPKSSGRRGHFYFGLFVFAGFDLADTSSGKHDFMSGVNQTVKDRVSYRRFSDCLEPIIHRQL